MKRERLTPGRISGYMCGQNRDQDFFWDTESPRLGVRVTMAGAKSFVFESKIQGRTLRWTIGPVSAWTLEAARAEANELQTKVDKGIDPREQARDQAREREAKTAALEAEQHEAAKRSLCTLKALCNEYVAHLEGQGKRKSAADAISAFKCHLFEPHPELAATYAGAVTAHQAAAIIRQVLEAGKPRTAGILRSYLAAAYNAAMRAPFNAFLPAALIPFEITTNPILPVATIAIKARDRVLTADELTAYMRALGDSLADRALRLALLAGGQRMRQLLQARLGDFDELAGSLRLFDRKGRRTAPREHVIPLGHEGLALAQALAERARQADKEFLFYSGKGGAMDPVTPGHRVRDISKALGGEPFDLLDIRRTAETMLAGLGVSQDIRAQLLSHGLGGVQVKHYVRHLYLKEKRQALTRWERHLTALLHGGQRSTVIPLAARR
ncbi:MAG: integrase family protein [Desulfobacteraceae bacterium]|nr:integrase family protein [Desulfobacteraceae bacterium]